MDENGQINDSGVALYHLSLTNSHIVMKTIEMMINNIHGEGMVLVYIDLNNFIM